MQTYDHWINIGVSDVTNWLQTQLWFYTSSVSAVAAEQDKIIFKYNNHSKISLFTLTVSTDISLIWYFESMYLMDKYIQWDSKVETTGEVTSVRYEEVSFIQMFYKVVNLTHS